MTTPEQEHPAIAQARTMFSDTFDNVVHDLTQEFITPLEEARAEVLRLEKDNERLQQLNGESQDFEWGVCLEYLTSFVASARGRDEYVDVINLVYSRLQAEWEVKDYYSHPDIAQFSGADIRAMLVNREQCNPDNIYIDDAKMYKVPHSPGGGTTLSNLASHINAYYYKAKCHEVGVESVGITNLGTVVGVEERLVTAGSQGIVDRFLRTYLADPGDVLPREWNNAKIWPAISDYTEIRF